MPSAEAEVTAVDSSVIIAALLGWHRHHAVARRLLDAGLESGNLLVPSRALTESYSVLTRLPAPHRLAPRAAMDLLTGTLGDASTIVDLPTTERWAFLSRIAEEGVAGGAVYDAEIIAMALRAGARRLLTLNVGDFERLVPADLKIGGPPTAGPQEPDAPGARPR
jgi:predicted nucleic acid-binding protein